MSNLNQRRQIVQSVLQSERSDFYRRLYKKKMGVDSLKKGFPEDEKEWANMPFLEKKDLVETPVTDRMFFPRPDINIHRYSTGTSGGEILVSMRDRSLMGRNNWQNMKRVMSFLCPYETHFRGNDGAIIGMVGEVGDLALSARIVRLSGVDAFVSPPAVVVALIPHLKKENIMESIRGLFLVGDRLTGLQYKLFREAFPRAAIITGYGLTEIGGTVTELCTNAFSEESEGCFHSVDEYVHFELVDEDDEIISETGTSGEIVITTLLENNPQPMIRYRTGDMASYVSQKCECRATTQAFVVHGRKYLDRILMPKGELRIAEVDRVLKRFKDRIDGEYEVHSYEDESAIQSKPSVIVKVRPYEKNENMEQLARDISQDLRVTPNRTYADNVDADLIHPLECGLLDHRPQLTPAGKVKRFFRHQI